MNECKRLNENKEAKFSFKTAEQLNVCDLLRDVVSSHCDGRNFGNVFVFVFAGFNFFLPQRMTECYDAQLRYIVRR